MTASTQGTLAETLAAVLGEHAWAGTQGQSTDEHPLGRYSQCICGWVDDYDLDPFGPWRAHVAAALAARVEAETATAVGEFLTYVRAAAQEWHTRRGEEAVRDG